MEPKELKALIRQRVWGRETRGIAIGLPLSLISVAVITVLVPPSTESAPLSIRAADIALGVLVILATMMVLSAIDYRRRLAVLRELTHNAPEEPEQATRGAKMVELGCILAGAALAIIGSVLPNHFCLLGAMSLILFAVGLYFYKRYVVADDEKMKIVRHLSD